MFLKILSSQLSYMIYRRILRYLKPRNFVIPSIVNPVSEQTLVRFLLLSGAIGERLKIQNGRISTLVCLSHMYTASNLSHVDFTLGRPENYTQLCNIVTDLSHVPLSPMTNPDGEVYYRIYYDIVLLFGLTEMKALVAWKEKVCFFF